MTSWPDRSDSRGVRPGLVGEVVTFSPKLQVIIGPRIGHGEETGIYQSNVLDTSDGREHPIIAKAYNLRSLKAEEGDPSNPFTRTTKGRALREAQMWADLTALAQGNQESEPPFPRFLGMKETEDNIFLFMEQGAPRNVEQLLDSGKKFSPYEVFIIMRNVLKGLSYMQTLGIVHRDVRSANVLFDPEHPTGSGRPMLVDLSIGERLSEIPISVYGANNRGTSSYIAPEQAAGPFNSVLEERADATLEELENRSRSKISFATDTLGAGLLLYELLGEHLGTFHARRGRITDFGRQIYMSQPTYARELPLLLGRDFGIHPGLVEVFRRAIAFDPKDRFQTAGDFYVAFAQAFKTVYGYVPPES